LTIEEGITMQRLSKLNSKSHPSLLKLPLVLTALLAINACAKKEEAPAAAVAPAPAATPATASAPPATPQSVDPAATAALKRMTDYLASLPAFSLDTSNTLDVVLDSGQKIQFDSATSFTAQRPNMFYGKRHGDIIKQDFFYDGKNLTLSNPDSNVYAVIAAPATIDETLDFIANELDIVAPAADLLHKDALQRLTGNATNGIIVGQSVIEGKTCDHLAFRSPDVDIQVWMETGDKPAPCKYVITTTDLPSMPEFSVTVRNFNAAPKLNDGMFKFTPPQGATQIDFLKK
jgi:hypothetical protein